MANEPAGTEEPGGNPDGALPGLPADLMRMAPPLPLEAHLDLARAHGKRNMIRDRKTRTRALLTGGTGEEPKRAPPALPDHLSQPRAVSKR